MKWSNSSSDPAGPIQVKRFNDAWGKFSWERNTFVELTGVIGVSESSSTLTSIGGTSTRTDIEPAKEKVGERFAWTVSRSNVNEILAAIQTELVTLKANRPVRDERRTVEQETARNEEHKQIDKRQAEESAKQRATFTALYGDGGTVTVPDGCMAITAKIHYNNSDAMTDYFDGHASLSPAFALMIVPKQAETEKLARQAVSRYPELASVAFEWKTEKYSMGHGNYLTGPGFELPQELHGIRKYYRGGDVTHGFWEIEFNHTYRGTLELSKFKGWPGSSGTSATTATEPVTSAVGAGVTIKENTDKDGIEIHFDAKPASDVIERLKAHGWRWSRFNSCWYKRASEQAREFANQFVTVAV